MSSKLCPFCSEEAKFCPLLHKQIHANNRAFLPSNHILRNSNKLFANLNSDNRSKPAVQSNIEISMYINRHGQKENNSQRVKFRQKTGMKGPYSLTELLDNDRINQSSQDGMHTNLCGRN